MLGPLIRTVSQRRFSLWVTTYVFMEKHGKIILITHFSPGAQLLLINAPGLFTSPIWSTVGTKLSNTYLKILLVFGQFFFHRES